MNKVLIIQTAFLGDVILATPLISEIKRLFPESRIDFLLKKGNEQLLANNPDLNEIFTFDKKSGKWKEMRRLIKEIRGTHYVLVINLHRFASSGLITVLSGAQKKYGFKKNPLSFLYTRKFEHNIGNGEHEVERNLSLIKEFGGQDRIRPSLYPSTEDRNAISEYIASPYFTMAPASVWYTKQLPKEKWVELIKRKSDKATVYLIGGPGDHDLCAEIINETGIGNVQNLCGQLSLLQSAALMERAERNYVNDSGPLHIASAMNAPVTAFFCSTITEFGFGPLSDDSAVIEVKDLECRPCGLHGFMECPEGHFKCGHDMDVSNA